MSFTLQEIKNFNSEINISPNIILNIIKALNNTKNNSSIRIYYLIKDNDQIFFNSENEHEEKFFNCLFYEIFIIKIDFIRNKSKMIMIYNNEKKEYKIKIWASKLEKEDIKNEYNKIIKKICDKKNGNNILKNLLKLKPDKYTIYYFPYTVTLFEKELVFIYILIITQNEKSKFQNFKQIKDLILYSKSYLIPKINEILFKTNKKTLKIYKSKNNCKNINNDNKENVLINNNNNIQRKINKKMISPKSKVIQINYNTEKFKKIINRNSNYCKKSINFMKKPYNKIVFNYSFEKNDNEMSINRHKDMRKSFIEPRTPATNVLINSYKSDKSYNCFDSFPINKYRNINHENINETFFRNLPFSITSKNNNNNNTHNNTIPYEKKRPSSIPRKIMHYFSSNHFISDYNSSCIEKDKEKEIDLNNNYKYNFITFDNKSNKNKKIIYKRKSYSKQKTQESIDSNSNYIYKKINSIDSTKREKIFKKKTNSITLKKYRRNNRIAHNGSMKSLNSLIKTYSIIKDVNEKNNISKIPINKKTTFNINYNNLMNKKKQINNGNKTSRNIANKLRNQLIYKEKKLVIKKLNRTRDNCFPKINDSEEEISLFI